MDIPTNNDGASAPRDATRRVADAAHDLADRAKGAAQEQLQAGAQRAERSLSGAADALRHAADNVSGDQAWIAKAMRTSADGIERATGALAGGDIEAAARNLRDFARRQPAIFLGASLAVGFALARVGKTALEHDADATELTGE